MVGVRGFEPPAPASRNQTANRRVMNCQGESTYSILLVVGGPDRSRFRCHWRGAASVADDAVSVGRRLRVRPILRSAE